MPKKRKPSKPSPKPAPAKRKVGRPEGGGFKPTGEQAEKVRFMSSIGIPEDRMVHAIINPETKAPISPVTLRKHFREALDQGLLEADMKAAFNLLKQTESSAAAAIFWVKCRLRWRERVAVEFPPPGPEGSPEADADKHSMLEIARRVAFVLSMGAEAAKPSAPSKPAPQRHKEPA